MNQLKIKSPQAFQMINQAKNNGGNPIDLFKQVTNGYSTEQMNGLFTRAKQFGVPENVIEQLQNDGINSK